MSSANCSYSLPRPFDDASVDHGDTPEGWFDKLKQSLGGEE